MPTHITPLNATLEPPTVEGFLVVGVDPSTIRYDNELAEAIDVVNYDYVMSQIDQWESYYHNHCEWTIIPDTPEYRGWMDECLRSLDHYPVLDDSALEAMECQQICRSWPDIVSDAALHVGTIDDDTIQCIKSIDPLVVVAESHYFDIWDWNWGFGFSTNRWEDLMSAIGFVIADCLSKVL